VHLNLLVSNRALARPMTPAIFLGEKYGFKLYSVAERKGQNNQVAYYQHNRQYMYPEILQAIACNLRNRPEKYSIRAVSNLLGVSKSTIHRWMHLKFKAERKGRTRSLICYEKVIRDYVGLNSDCRLKDKTLNYYLQKLFKGYPLNSFFQ
jgi:ppGpp synthetase/RelA/SpoT-type nucleotidyltranferase